jgi:hypothetical protein
VLSSTHCEFVDVITPIACSSAKKNLQNGGVALESYLVFWHEAGAKASAFCHWEELITTPRGQWWQQSRNRGLAVSFGGWGTIGPHDL